MDITARPEEILIDYITGHTIPNAGAEENRQQVERFLVEIKGYNRRDIEVDAEIILDMADEGYQSSVDLVVRMKGFSYMVIKCAAGSLSSREREVIAAARLLTAYQVPLAIASDGRTALVWDTVSGNRLGQSLDAVPSKTKAAESFNPATLVPLAAKRRSRQQLIFKSYDTMNLNRAAGR